MVLENLKSAFDNIVDRFKSPFAGTFIVVWCLHHWILVYSLFNFDANCTLPDKLAQIGNYLAIHSYCDLIWLPIGYTFLAIFAFFALHIAALAISTFFTSIIRPLVIRMIDKGPYIEKTEYLALKMRIEEIDKEHTSTSLKYSTLTKTHNDLLDEVGELEENIANANLEIRNLQNEASRARPIIVEDNQNRSVQLHSIFTNEWIVNYEPIYPAMNNDSKRISLTIDDAIYVDGKMEANAKNVYYDRTRGYLSFDTIKLGGQSKVSTVLVKIDDTSFEGVENGASRYKVKYNKYIPPLELYHE